MHLDVVELRDFYASLLGRVVVRHLGAVVRPLIKVDAATRVLGFGFPTPYLASVHGAERVFAFMPAGQGVIEWPSGGNGSATALVEEDALPLPDASIDLVLMIHALEMSAHPPTLMAELRRVLTNSGRIVIVAPTRPGPWARSDISPFGFGRPYSRSQIRSLFAEAGFEAEAWATALHMPPSRRRALLKLAGLFDRVGRVVWPAFAGVVVVVAARRTVQGMRVRARLRIAPALRPALGPVAGAVPHRTP
jgi:SAM-dependent methyltransferase